MLAQRAQAHDLSLLRSVKTTDRSLRHRLRNQGWYQTLPQIGRKYPFGAADCLLFWLEIRQLRSSTANISFIHPIAQELMEHSFWNTDLDQSWMLSLVRTYWYLIGSLYSRVVIEERIVLGPEPIKTIRRVP